MKCSLSGCEDEELWLRKWRSLYGLWRKAWKAAEGEVPPRAT